MTPSHDVRVFLVDCAVTPDDAIRLSALLTPEERRRAGRFHRASDARHWIAARAGLRRVLASHIGMPAARVPLVRGENGKPRLALPGNSLCFNLSHSGGLALVAVGTGGEVGVDIEALRQDFDPMPLVERVCTGEEGERVRQASAHQRAELFLRLWTSKEAFLKAEGVGLLADPSRIRVGEDCPDGRVPVCGPGGSGPFKVHRVTGLPGGYVAAVAAPPDALMNVHAMPFFL